MHFPTRESLVLAAAADIELTAEEVATLDGLAAQTVGGRY